MSEAMASSRTNAVNSRGKLDASIAAATDALLALPAGGRALGVRARGRRHDPGRICAAAPLSRRAAAGGARAKDRRLSAPHPGRAWRLAAVSRRRFRHERQRQGLFRAEDDRRLADAPHMRRAREAILARGGAAASNVFTRILLALFGMVPWRCVPVMPVEIMLLPRWFPFHLSKISYWCAHRHRAAAGVAGAEGRAPAIRRACASTNCSSNRR